MLQTDDGEEAFESQTSRRRASGVDASGTDFRRFRRCWAGSRERANARTRERANAPTAARAPRG